jgi:hypothetical protein
MTGHGGGVVRIEVDDVGRRELRYGGRLRPPAGTPTQGSRS